MKKETVNTFDKGLVKDLHPLTTPNNVLTDALNATLITYNGNEMVLQNDMGNTKVGTAFLPAGYVPVGMKEHGGIIYVVAYNPETKKGQIGSYPSPKQLWEGEDWSVNTEGAVIDNISLNTNQFYGLEDGTLDANGDFIVNETVKTLLFKFTDGTMREFHPGDKYALAIANTNVYQLIQSYVNEGKIKLQLGVVRKDGSIEIMADAREDWFLFNGTASTYIANNTPRVFNASSSGSLILIVNIVTLDSFNLIREYELSNDNQTVIVTFKGKGTRGQDTILTSGPDLKLYGGQTGYAQSDQSQIQIQGTNETKKYTIYPQVPWGIIRRMKKSGSINFDQIRKTEGSFHEWRFFVNEDYIKIGWAYEFYNLGNKKTLDGIQMDFYDIVKPDSFPNNPDATIVFQKDSYSGNFEDYIRFDQHPQIKRMHVYVIRLSKKVRGSGLETITHKMLYCSPLYNEYYNQAYINPQTGEELEVDLSTCVEYQRLNIDDIGIKFEQTVDCEKQGITTATVSTMVRDGTSTNIVQNVDIIALNNRYYVTDDPNAQAHDFEYITKLTNSYKATGTITASYDIQNKNIIGVPNPSYLNTVLDSNNITASGEVIKNLNWRNLHSTSDYFLNSNVKDQTSQVTTTLGTVSNGERVIELTFSDDRYIEGANSSVISEPYSTVDWAPLYDPNALDKQNVFYSYLSESPQVLSGEKGEQIRYASTLVNYDIVDGTDGGGGDSNQGLAAANRAINSLRPPTVNMFAGTGGEKASLRMDGASFICERHAIERQDINGWWIDTPKNDGMEVDDKDNFLAAVWKFTDGNAKMVNLFSRKDWPANASETWPRLDVMLKCFLSQIFIAQRVTKKNSYVTSDPNFYRYLEGTDCLSVKINGTSTRNSDIMMPYNDDDVELEQDTTLYEYAQKWMNKNLDGLVNLVPQVGASGTIEFTLDSIEIDNDFGMDSIIRFYQGVKMDAEKADLDLGKIMILDRNEQAYNITCGSTSTDKLTPMTDGAFRWTKQPKLKEASLKSEGRDARQDSCDILYDWTGGTWTMKTSLYRMFITRAKYLGITDLTNDNEYNELLGNMEEAQQGVYPHYSRSMQGQYTMGPGWAWGKWTEGSPDANAPDLYFSVLSSDKSLYKLFYKG